MPSQIHKGTPPIGEKPIARQLIFEGDKIVREVAIIDAETVETFKGSITLLATLRQLELDIANPQKWQNLGELRLENKP